MRQLFNHTEQELQLHDPHGFPVTAGSQLDYMCEPWTFSPIWTCSMKSMSVTPNINNAAF